MHTTRPLTRVGALLAVAALVACDQKTGSSSPGATTTPAGSASPAGPTHAGTGAGESTTGTAEQFIPQATKPDGAAENTYTTRGVIVALPGPNTAKQYLQIHHEAIPEFVGRSGTVTGMKEMIMDFPDVAPGEVVRGIKVGDAVRFTFEVRWKSTPRTLVTKIEKLPPEEKPKLSEVVEGG